ncbi:MAG: hypothetical protein J5787_00760 [Alphaproteobacteria bacterium]|nr:hypothetical protein [Alphaproteobacteria bacterium]
MKEYLHIVFYVFSAFFTIDATLYLYIKKKQNGSTKWLKKKIREYFVSYLSIVLIFFVYFFFFEDRSVYLECQKDAMTCSYSRTTYFNKEMRLVETYDISRVLYARVKKNVRFGRHARHYYTVELVEKNDSFSLDPEYRDTNAAAREAQRFNRFLSGTGKLYIFRKEPLPDSLGTVIGFIAGLFGFFLSIGFLWDLLCAAFKMRKKANRRPQKKKAPPSDDIIQRNR